MSYLHREWIVFGPKTGYSVIDAPMKGLYFIYCKNPESVKIGVSASPTTRRTTLNTGSPSELHLIFYSKLLGKDAEDKLKVLLHEHNFNREWYYWNPEIQGFLLGVIFGISGVIQVSWPFAGDCDSSMFISGVKWVHRILDPDGNWTLAPMTGMDGEKAFELFQTWKKSVFQTGKKSIGNRS